MSPVIAEPMCSAHLMLSTRLVSEVGDPHSTLRATTDRNGAAVLINAGGEVDACGLNRVLPIYPTADAALASAARW